MLRMGWVVAVLAAVSAPSAACADDLGKKIVEYFAGQWEESDADGTVIGTVDWKVVADGKAIAGPGTYRDGGTGFVLAGWDASEKKWVHIFYGADGSSGRLEVTRWEDGVLYGQNRLVDSQGRVTKEDFQCKIVDQNRAELTMVTDGQRVVTHWKRITR